MSYMMGIDFGRRGTRAVIVRPDGHVMGASTGDHEPMRMSKPGWAEQDPEDWWRAAVQAVRAVFERTGLSGKDIAAVGLSGQMHGVVLLDRANSVLHPALIWCDQRSQAQCDWITARVGSKRLIQLVSNPALTGFSAPKLLWVRERSEEHTSELQSRLHLVCRLLLEKKKQTRQLPKSTFISTATRM